MHAYHWLTPSPLGAQVLRKQASIEDGDTTRTYFVEDTDGRLGLPLFFPGLERPPTVRGVPMVPRWGTPLYEPRDYQAAAVLALGRTDHGILKLDPGRGKTFTSLYAAWLLGEPLLVVVPSETLLRQWQDAVIRIFGVPENDIGVIQGPPETWRWQEPSICIAMLQTLAFHYENRPPGITERFGVVIFDEVHHLQAQWFAKGVAYASQRRWGLSATPFAGGPLDQALEWNFDGICHDDDAPFQVPLRIEVWPLEAPATYDISQGYGVELRAVLARRSSRLALALQLAEAYAATATALLVQHPQVKVLEGLAREFCRRTGLNSEVGVLHGGVPRRQRAAAVGRPILFGLQHHSMTQEGFDKPEVDVQVVVGPVTGFRGFHQILGRAGRLHPGKEQATVAFIVDEVPDCLNTFHRRLEEAARKGASIEWMPRTPG